MENLTEKQMPAGCSCWRGSLVTTEWRTPNYTWLTRKEQGHFFTVETALEDWRVGLSGSGFWHFSTWPSHHLDAFTLRPHAWHTQICVCTCVDTQSSTYELSTHRCTYIIFYTHEHSDKRRHERSLTNTANHRRLENILISMNCHKDNCRIASILMELGRPDL